jgi:hypothetical protein
MGVVLKELNETAIWLKVIERSELLPRELLVDIIQENVALCKIFTSSLKTARGNSVMLQAVTINARKMLDSSCVMALVPINGNFSSIGN